MLFTMPHNIHNPSCYSHLLMLVTMLKKAVYFTSVTHRKQTDTLNPCNLLWLDLPLPCICCPSPPLKLKCHIVVQDLVLQDCSKHCTTLVHLPELAWKKCKQTRLWVCVSSPVVLGPVALLSEPHPSIFKLNNQLIVKALLDPKKTI